MNIGIAVEHTPDFRRRHKGPNRHDTTTKCFGRGDDIRCNVPMLNSPQLASTPHSGLYFVRDQENFVFVTELAQVRPEIIRWNNCSRFTLYRLHDDSSDIVANLACDLQLLLNSIGIAIRYMVNVTIQWHDWTAENSLSRKSKGPRGLPMESKHCSE